jgi:hypothetical protein
VRATRPTPRRPGQRGGLHSVRHGGEAEFPTSFAVNSLPHLCLGSLRISPLNGRAKLSDLQLSPPLPPGGPCFCFPPELGYWAVEAWAEGWEWLAKPGAGASLSLPAGGGPAQEGLQHVSEGEFDTAEAATGAAIGSVL